MYRSVLRLVVFMLGMVLIGFEVQIQAQSPYQVKPTVSIAIGGIGGGAFLVGKRSSARMDILSQQEIDRLAVEDLFPLNQSTTRKKSLFAKRVSDVTGYGSMILPLTLLADREIRTSTGQLIVLYSQAFSLTGGLTTLVKNTAKQPRPYVYNPDIPLLLKQKKDARRSFFSGHTSVAAMNAFFTTRVYTDFKPSQKANPWLWTATAIFPAVTGTTRVLSGQHFWTDVLVGYIVGAGVGLLVPRLHLD